MRSALAKQSGSTGGVMVMFRVSLVTALLDGFDDILHLP